MPQCHRCPRGNPPAAEATGVETGRRRRLYSSCVPVLGGRTGWQAPADKSGHKRPSRSPTAWPKARIPSPTYSPTPLAQSPGCVRPCNAMLSTEWALKSASRLLYCRVERPGFAVDFGAAGKASLWQLLGLLERASRKLGRSPADCGATCGVNGACKGPARGCSTAPCARPGRRKRGSTCCWDFRLEPQGS
jgi:hypothetical protein